MDRTRRRRPRLDEYCNGTRLRRHDQHPGGRGTTNVWDLAGANAGNLDGTLEFSGFQNPTGGAMNDTFAFLPAGSISGNLDGEAPVNTLDYSAYGSAATVNLQT